MFNKKIKAMLFIFVILFCVAAVNAEQIDTYIDDVPVEEASVESGITLVATADESSNTAGNFSALNKTINGGSAASAAEESDSVIKLNKDYIYNSTTDSAFKNGINITSSKIIDGDGHKIDGNHTARIFNVSSGATLTLKNIILVNGNATYGGAIYSNGTLNLTNVTFANNSATKWGGAVYSNGTAIIAGSTFDSNNITMRNSSSKNSDNVDYGGAAIFANGKLTVTDSKIINNIKNYANGHLLTGAITAYGNVTLTNSYFANNSGRWGGAFSASSELSKKFTTTYIDNCTFENNRAIYGGGAWIYGTTLNITDSTFTNNTAFGKGNMTPNNNNGGALCIYGNNTTGVISGSFFDGNEAHYGGAISFSENDGVTVKDSIFKNNNATYGGAISSSSAIKRANELTVINSTFINNTATIAAGAIYDSENLEIKDSSFVNNTAGKWGGAVYSFVNLTVSNSTFDGNDITNRTAAGKNATDKGGAAILSKGNLTISDSKFVNNVKNYQNGDLLTGAVTAYGNATLTNSYFANNSGRWGGAFSASSELSKKFTTTDIDNCTFENNRAIYGGGAWIYGTTLNITDSTFTNNTAFGKGNMTPNNNNGGALCIYGNNTTGIIEGSTFDGNEAHYGGAISFSENDGVTIKDSTFKNNNATNGGAISSSSGKDRSNNITIIDSTFENNTATGKGGAIHNTEDITITGSTFTNNNGTYGDDIYTSSNDTVVKGNTYTEGSYANIYANNTIINGTVIKVLNNGTYYVTPDGKYIVNANAFVDGASINGYDVVLTDGENSYNATYIGNGVYQINETLTANFTEKQFTAIINNNTNGNYIVENGTVNNKVNVTVEVAVDDIFFGENITANITIKDANGTVVNITGKVTVKIGDKEYLVDIVNGTGKVTITDSFNPGNYTMIVMFNETANYNAAEGSANFTIKGIDDVLVAYNLTKYYGADGKLIIILTDYKGTPLAGKTVTILINGVTYTRTTDENGTIAMNINLIPGVYEAKVSYENLTANATVAVLPTIMAEDIVKFFRNGTQYYATFYDVNGTPLANTNVTFNIHGIFYTRETDENGTAKLNINLNPGEYIITAYNPVNNESFSNNITVLTTVFGDDLVKYFKNGTQYYATFLDENGNPLANTNVTFNINGVFYTRETDENGIAKLNINLNPGEYVITAINPVNNETHSNVIKVLTVIESENIEMTTQSRIPFEATILGDHGEPLANATVTFNIHGVFYTKTTDANGVVSLNINLLAGEYIITTMYNGLSKSNTITVY